MLLLLLLLLKSRNDDLYYVCGLKSFCCIDKKGVLSWPNPTAEKVFILTDINDMPHAHATTQRSVHTSRHHSKRHSTVSATGDPPLSTDVLHTEARVTPAHKQLRNNKGETCAGSGCV